MRPCGVQRNFAAIQKYDGDLPENEDGTYKEWLQVLPLKPGGRRGIAF
jgi:hypothetical protein